MASDDYDRPVDTPGDPKQASRPRTVRAMPLGIVIALIVGCVLVFTLSG